ncbi:MAG TPA: hypothetical protein VGD37_42660 [Kofleriaceae bacterium]|jgi:hypothetical protein
MKAVVALVLLVTASCAAGSEPEIATADEAISLVPVLPQVSTSCQWVPGKNCYGLPNDGNNIWPGGMGITSVQVLTRSGPDRLEHTQATFLAFVVWNRTTMGRIFRIDIGPDGADWRAALSNITATRTLNNLDFNTGSTGTAAGGPVNPPHPNVDGQITFDPTYLDVVKRYAGVIDSASAQFLATRAPVIDGQVLTTGAN